MVEQLGLEHVVLIGHSMGAATAAIVAQQYPDKVRALVLEQARAKGIVCEELDLRPEDLLEAEKQLTEREAEIESIKGRMQYLEQSARLSSIWIELQPYILNQPVGDEWRPAETVRRGVDALLVANAEREQALCVGRHGRALCGVADEGITGAITGRAIYEGSLDLAAAQKLADELCGDTAR